MKFTGKVTLSTILLISLGICTVQAQLAGQMPLSPMAVPQFVDPLPHFAGLRLDATAGGNMTITIKATTQRAVSTGTVLAAGASGIANFWAYELEYNGITKPVSWPAFTIEAERGNALHVEYVNALFGQIYENVGLVVDQTLHWANPNDLDMDDPARFDPFGDEPPAVVHLHGGEVPPFSDGGPDSWFTPGNAETGHAFNPDPYYYPNTQESATLWFHDHALGATRLNVYAGMAGFYFLRDPNEADLKLPGFQGDGKVQEAAGGFRGTDSYLPEIEIAIQDRMFDTNGQLYFPNVGLNPEHPFWVPEFVGDIITVNGRTWPYLSVAPRRYRFRILNGSNARFYELWLQNLATGAPGPIIHQIGTDGGFLDNSVAIDPTLGQKLTLGPGERADVVIDFTGQTGLTWTLRNSGRTPYPKGGPPQGSTVGRILQFKVNGNLVDPDASNPPPYTLKNNVKLTDFLGSPATGVPVSKVRQLTLNEVIGAGGPLEILVNNTLWDGTNRAGFTPVINSDGSTTYYSETMEEGSTEIWQIINLTADAHPIHLHLVQYQLMSRQKFNLNKYNNIYNAAFPGGVFNGGYGPPIAYNAVVTHPIFGLPTIGGNPEITPFLQGMAKPANPNEKGWKDTFIMYPGEVTTVIARWAPTDKPATADPTKQADGLWFGFDPNGGHGYVWHCHIIDHEDNEMMRPYNVIPSPFNPYATSVSSAVLAKAGNTEGASDLSSAVVPMLPSEYGLSQNYPNPFNPTTEIPFALPQESYVQLKIYNSLGQEVATLIDGNAPAGFHTMKLDAGNLASGIYFYRINAGNFTQMKKMILIK